MSPLTGREVHEKFLEFFEKHNHQIIPSHSLIPPADDKSGLFVNSGMHPLKKYFKGEAEPPAKRLANDQRSFRTNDFENIGDTYHNTLFFMLGNWSIGDYWKKEAINFAYDLLVNEFGLDPQKLWATYFESDLDGVPTDEETKAAWLETGIPHNQIVGLGAEDNFWAAGPVGPCGPCTEMYYDLGEKEGWCGNCDGPGCESCGRYLEVWNCAVCMQYDRQEDGSLKPLPFKSIDAGAGLERITSVLQKVDNIYDSDLFRPLMDEIHILTKKDEKKNLKSFRIISDHIRAACFLIGDGIRPGNLEREYVLRRLLRRLVREAMKLEANPDFLIQMADKTITEYGPWWPELEQNQDDIQKVISEEQASFEKTLAHGLREMNKLDIISTKDKFDNGELAFYFFETYGFPKEMFAEEIEARGYQIDHEEFDKQFDFAFGEHQTKSRESMVGKFKGGLAEGGDESQKTQYHTTTHLMLEALRRTLGQHVEQKGSNITDERLRFDFSHDQKLEPHELEAIEKIVNEQIEKDLPVSHTEMSLEEAKQKGATGVFEDRYENQVKVYTIGEPGQHFSMEICGGPHVEKTSDIKGKFKIQKEQSSSGGVRRIKAILEK